MANPGTDIDIAVLLKIITSILGFGESRDGWPSSPLVPLSELVCAERRDSANLVCTSHFSSSEITLHFYGLSIFYCMLSILFLILTVLRIRIRDLFDNDKD
jgi:hypothetical protein